MKFLLNKEGILRRATWLSVRWQHIAHLHMALLASFPDMQLYTVPPTFSIKRVLLNVPAVRYSHAIRLHMYQCTRVDVHDQGDNVLSLGEGTSCHGC
jgi:hypothetical protein